MMITAVSPYAQRRHLMKSYVALAKSRIISDAQGGHVRPAVEPDHVEGANHKDGRDHGGGDTDDQGNRKSLYRAGPDQVENEGGEGRAHVRVDDGAHGVQEALVHGGAHQLPVLQLFTDALEDQHVRIDGDATDSTSPASPGSVSVNP